MDFDWSVVGWIVAALLVGGLIGGAFFAKEVNVKNPVNEDLKDKVKDLQKKLSEKSEVVVKEKEVVKEVVAHKELLNESVKELLKYLDDEDLIVCNNDSYDAKEVEVSKVYDEYFVVYDEEDRTVDFKVKLKHKQDDLKSCYNTYETSVFYEEDEKAVVSI